MDNVIEVIYQQNSINAIAGAKIAARMARQKVMGEITRSRRFQRNAIIA